mmetsp:Transcript_17816/g.40467  ORF Transcript_17816/g.40467 Transcript_17816/m.40467 type:complete len:334 (-) Transcript_17816:231-1232(-)
MVEMAHGRWLAGHPEHPRRHRRALLDRRAPRPRNRLRRGLRRHPLLPRPPPRRRRRPGERALLRDERRLRGRNGTERGSPVRSDGAAAEDALGRGQRRQPRALSELHRGVHRGGGGLRGLLERNVPHLQRAFESDGGAPRRPVLFSGGATVRRARADLRVPLRHARPLRGRRRGDGRARRRIDVVPPRARRHGGPLRRRPRPGAHGLPGPPRRPPPAPHPRGLRRRHARAVRRGTLPRVGPAHAGSQRRRVRGGPVSGHGGAGLLPRRGRGTGRRSALAPRLSGRQRGHPPAVSGGRGPGDRPRRAAERGHKTDAGGNGAAGRGGMRPPDLPV